LIGENFHRRDLAWFNRLLLEDVYPHEIRNGTFVAPNRVCAVDYGAYPDLLEAAKALAPFEEKTATLWWEVAEKLLRRITRFGLQGFPSLTPLAKTERVRSLKKSAGTEFSEVVKHIKPVFLRLCSSK
jgi:hypothetical protein